MLGVSIFSCPARSKTSTTASRSWSSTKTRTPSGSFSAVSRYRSYALATARSDGTLWKIGNLKTESRAKWPYRSVTSTTRWVQILRHYFDACTGYRLRVDYSARHVCIGLATFLSLVLKFCYHYVASGVTKGDICLRAQNFGSAELRTECYVLITKCQMSADTSNYDLENVECQQLLPSCKTSSRSPRFSKRAIMNLSDVSKRSFGPQRSAFACSLTHDCVTMVSDSHGRELSHFALILHVRNNGTGIQHSQCMQPAVLRMLLEQRWKHVVTRGVQRGWKRGDGPGHQAGGIQRVKLRKVHFVKILKPDQGCTIFCEY